MDKLINKLKSIAKDTAKYGFEEETICGRAAEAIEQLQKRVAELEDSVTIYKGTVEDLVEYRDKVKKENQALVAYIERVKKVVIDGVELAEQPCLDDLEIGGYYQQMALKLEPILLYEAPQTSLTEFRKEQAVKSFIEGCQAVAEEQNCPMPFNVQHRAEQHAEMV
ncbi:MAG: hypothetical protein CL489_08480 [Acidobacteria bacterium]|nr:hypothetical protein [Acidobacteriota bacterium]|tara:strand:- start:50013 stop:50510 length:498 start_codon:yes stop_codon:yes gene_type:complete